jgi:hypothetical protein
MWVGAPLRSHSPPGRGCCAATTPRGRRNARQLLRPPPLARPPEGPWRKLRSGVFVSDEGRLCCCCQGSPPLSYLTNVKPRADFIWTLVFEFLWQMALCAVPLHLVFSLFRVCGALKTAFEKPLVAVRASSQESNRPVLKPRETAQHLFFPILWLLCKGKQGHTVHCSNFCHLLQHVITISMMT